MLVAVFHRPDGTVSVMRPVATLRGGSETEQAFVQRIAEQDGPKSPLTDGIPFVVVDQTMLPARVQADAQGDTRPCRDAWRWNIDHVELVDAEIPPNLTALLPRLRTAIPADQWPAGAFSDLREAIAAQDLAMMRAVRDRLLAERPAFGAVVTQTFQEKRI